MTVIHVQYSHSYCSVTFYHIPTVTVQLPSTIFPQLPFSYHLPYSHSYRSVTFYHIPTVTVQLPSTIFLQLLFSYHLPYSHSYCSVTIYHIPTVTVQLPVRNFRILFVKKNIVKSVNFAYTSTMIIFLYIAAFTHILMTTFFNTMIVDINTETCSF